jgi:hypothetical protein
MDSFSDRPLWFRSREPMITCMRSGVAVLVLGVTLGLPVSAAAAVKRTAFTSGVPAGEYASLTVQVTPRSRCTIQVVYSTGPSRAAGLGAKIGGKITWRLRVGSNTKPGRWPVTVDCGKAGKHAAILRVRAS